MPREVDLGLGAGPQPLEASFWTLLLYEEEFDGADMVADTHPASGTVPWPAVAKALWACLKAADESVPPFKEWARAAKGVDLQALGEAVVAAVDDGLLRQGPAEPEEGRPRRGEAA